MILKNTNHGKIVVLKAVEKRLEANIAEELKKELKDIINNGNSLLVIDISDVNFIDSSGLGAIISSLKLLGSDGNIALSGAKEGVKSVLKLTRMDKIFKIFDNVKQAVNALSV